MLLPRVLTAVVLIPLVLWAIIVLGSLPFALLSGGLFLLGAYEWTALCEMTTVFKKGLYLVATIALMALLYFSQQASVLLLFAAFLWIIPIAWILFYQPQRFTYLGHASFRALLGLLVISFAWYALITLHALPNGPYWLIVLLILVWATDIFAYFVGRKWGNKKLAPLISPGKTQAGFWGGFVGALCLAVLGYFMKPLFFPNLPLWIMIACGTILFAVVGDLFESLMKRLSGVKDSGKIFPGHGGILDRLDSLMSSLPFFTATFLWLNR